MQSNDENSTHEAALFDDQALARVTMGDEVLQREVLQLFFMQVGEMVESFEGAQDETSWCRAAHTLKGSSQSVGLMSLGQMAEVAEGLSGAEGDVAWRTHTLKIKNEADKARALIAKVFPGIFD